MSRAHEQNIARYLRKATAEQVEDGASWYRRMHDELATLAHETKTDLVLVTACAAALSPQNRWRQNLPDTIAYVRAAAAGNPRPSASTFEANKAKAWRILTERDISPLSGRKVTAFFANLMQDPEHVTVDRWALRVATNDPTRDKVQNAAEYQDIANAFRKVASKTEYSPSQVQAITWLVVGGGQ